VGFDLVVPIRTSSGREIDSLVAGLGADDAAVREASVARLTVIGTRAVGRLVDLLKSSCPAPARAAAMRVFEGVGDPRALEAVLAALGDADPDVAAAAISSATVFLTGPRSTDVLDRLTATALEVRRHPAVRLAAIDALAGIGSATMKPLWKTLAGDPVAVVRSRAESMAGRNKPAEGPLRMLAAACEGELPDAAELHQAIVDGGSTAPLQTLHRLIERIRDREASAGNAKRAEWTKTRAAAHLALAQRDSRIALYDLREALEGASLPLPVEFLAALSQIGDSSCLEPVAAAYVRSARAGAPAGDWWRQHLAIAFRTIVARDRLTMRHAVMKKVVRRWGDGVRELVKGA
jgi:HEAT repeat protein